MPASICDPVSNALRLSLTADESQSSSLLDSRLYSSSKNVLLSKIEFEESGDYQSNVLDGLKSKYVVIRPKKPVLDSKLLKKESSSGSHTSDNTKNGEDGLPKPKRVLYSVEKVKLGWQSPWSAGVGMQNVGNTCYLNSTLQALFHVPAFANWLVSESSHAEQCNQQEACVICGMRATLMATQKSGGNPIKPWQVYSKLRLICRHLTPGRQEDAHEFLRYLMEAMEKCYLSRFMNVDKLDQYSKETTPMNQILGGYLRSTVRCLACHHLSTTYQHFQDLLLDIRKHSTLDEALDSFFSRERLEDLGYRCEACNKKVSATKQFFIERAPMVLCIALKRFSLAGGKLSKHIQFRKKICLNKYLYSKINHQQLSYKLVSLVTHLGPSQNCGHYTAVGQAPSGTYLQLDDSCVRPLPLSAVLATNAYIMFFERDPEPSSPLPCTSTSTSSAVYGPQLPENLLNRDKSPLKLNFRSDDRRVILNSSEMKPIILNSTLNRSSEPCKPEPWVVKQNGEVVKVSNGVDRSKQDDKRVSFVIKRPIEDDHSPVKSKLVRSESDMRPQGAKTPEKTLQSKLVRPPKSPLEKLEEQMNKNDSSKRNGSSKLVPYDSESSGDEKDPQLPKPSRTSAGGLVVTTTCMHRSWVVSRESNAPLLSPSLNGVTIKQVKEKEASPNTSVSSMSPASDAEGVAPRPRLAPTVAAVTAGGGGTQIETARYLQPLSHRGYGAPVAAWSGGQSTMSRQVFEERREQNKRAMEAQDEMDRGRNKKIKRYPHYQRFHNNRQYNPFQEKQNKVHWNGGGGGGQGGGGGFKYRADRRPPHHFNKHHNKHRRFNRYNNNNGNHYNRH